MVEAVSLYFHIPFCTKKCGYCHFFVLPDKDEFKQALMVGLEKEWTLRAPFLRKQEIVSIYFGGGTPSLLGPGPIERILSWIARDCHISTDIEITLEANPENVTHDLIASYAQAGINRLSIGVQTLDSPLLKQIGRTHDAKGAMIAVEAASHSISNISIDLMYDLPGQTLPSWEETLRQASALPITHLSLYNLTIEPHTSFYKHRAKLIPMIADEETSLHMYEAAIETLTKNNLKQYEISAFAKEGKISKHNTGYWTARPFFGLGPSAFSYWDKKRFRNCANLSKYNKLLASNQFPIDFEEQLKPTDSLKELLAINLRLLEGVDLSLFQQKHGLFPSELTSSLHKLENEGFLHSLDNRLSLTKKGILFYDTVAIEII